ncbi:MAG: murein biosynthesis integral membrane protein MurJ [Actinomycetota bacterium]|nr:murein biosynthesis integral membrane protein MurJ [Actinomycetota bacterium]
MTDQPDAGPPGPAEKDTGSRFVRHTAVMSVGTGLSRLTGFLRLSAMAYAIGVAHSQVAEAYTVANNTPNIVYELVLGGILTSVFVPVFVEWLDTRGRDEAWEVARSVMSIAMVVLTAILVLTLVAAPLFIRLYTLNLHGPKADAERALGTFFLRWFMPQIVFYGVGAVATGLLNAHRRFAVPMFAPILNNLIVIATMLAFAAMHGSEAVPSASGITAGQKLVLAVGTTLGVVAMTAVLWPSLRRLGFRFRWSFDWHHEAVRRIARLALWVFVYVAVNQLGLLVVIVLAAEKTAYAAYTAAFILFQLPHAIFAVSIMTALLPAMASRWTDRDLEGFRTMLARGLRGTAFIVIPAAAGYLALAGPIVRLLLQHGAAEGAQTQLVARILVFFSIGLFPFSAFQLLLRAFYATQDTRTPAFINIAAVSINTVMNFVFFHFYGVRGLALGFATAYTFAAVAAAVAIRRRLGGLEGRLVLAGLGKVLVGGAATGVVAYLAARGLEEALNTATLAGQTLQVLGAVAAGVATFLILAVLLRMEDLQLLRGYLGGRIRR